MTYIVLERNCRLFRYNVHHFPIAILVSIPYNLQSICLEYFLRGGENVLQNTLPVKLFLI